MSAVGGIEAGKAYVRLYTDSSEYLRGLKSAENKLRDFGSKVGSIGSSMARMATVAALPIALSTKTFSDFEDQMLAVQAVSQATGKDFERLYDQAKQLGATTSFTAGQVAGGQLSLARMGFSPAEIEASIPGVLNLARATGTDLAQAADIAAGTLRAFSLEAGEMNRVSDVLVATANNSAQTLDDLGESMKYVAPVAYQYGLSVEQTAKALGVLANLQIKGTMAGTSLRQVMLQLTDPAIQKQLEAQGVQILDNTGNLRPLGDVMIDVGRAMAKMTDAGRLALGKDLFGQRAVTAGLTLATQQFDGLSKAIDNANGVAARTAATMDSGLGGVLRILKSAVEGVQIAIGEAVTQQMKEWGTNATEIAAKTKAWIDNNKELIVAFTSLVAAVGVTSIALIGLGAAAKGTAAMIGLLTLASKGLTAGLGLIVAHPAVAIIVELGIALGILAKVLNDTSRRSISAAYGLDKLGAASRSAREAGALGSSATSVMAEKDITAAIRERITTAEKLADAIEKVRDSWMTSGAKSDMIEQLSTEMNRANEEAAALLKRLKELREASKAEYSRLETADVPQEEMWEYLRPAKPAETAPQEQMVTVEQEAEIQKLEDELAKLEIENKFRRPGQEKERDAALLELERQQQLRDAKSQFGTPGMESADAQSRILGGINRLFDAKMMAMELGAREAAFSAIDATRGTFSAEESWRMGLGNKVDDPAKKTAENTAAIATSAEETARETKMMRHAIQSGLRMGP